MGYIRKTYTCKHGVQVEEYHNFKRRPPGEKRKARAKPTPEKVRENNQRQKRQRAQRMMLEYFDEGDKYITLTYQGEKPTLQQVQKDMKRLIEFLKPRYAKDGTELRWIRNIERTKRGIYHIHLLLKKMITTDVGKIVREYWKERHGKNARVEDTYLDGGFERLAAYMTKTERDEDGNVLSSFSHSRNMPDVVPVVKEYVRRNVRSDGEWREIKEIKGYILLKDSIYEGFNEITGFPYRRYTLLGEKEKCKHTFT